MGSKYRVPGKPSQDEDIKKAVSLGLNFMALVVVFLAALGWVASKAIGLLAGS